MCAYRPANRAKGIGADTQTRDGEDITGERSDTTIAANRRATLGLLVSGHTQSRTVPASACPRDHGWGSRAARRTCSSPISGLVAGSRSNTDTAESRAPSWVRPLLRVALLGEAAAGCERCSLGELR